MSKAQKYDLIAPTSMGLRLFPENRQAVEVSRKFLLQSTSAESNVLQISASLGLRTKVLTAFVESNLMAQFLKNDLRMRGIEYDAPEIDAGGPWGYRHQINIADSGFGVRAPVVQNDRAGEVGQVLHQDLFDLDKLFFEDGVRMIHFSGLIVALSASTAEFCLTLAEKAKQANTLISFDLNHRASFWKDREIFLYERFHKIAQMADILIGNEEDFQLALKVPGPKTDGIEDIGQVKALYSELIKNVKQRYPQATTFATTIRHVISANEHGWGALLFSGDEFFEEPIRHIEIFDRIGGGDGFVGGLLYGILKSYSPKTCLSLGWAAGALAVASITDYAMPRDENQLWQVHAGNARVIR